MKKKASKLVTELTRLIFKPFSRLRYGFNFEMCRDIKPPCIVICNHAMSVDPLLVGCCLPFPINYVASDSLLRHKGISKLLNFLIQPIFKAKSMADTRTVMEIFSVIKQGGSVGIFPEGNRTMNGATVNIPEAIKKLIKKLRVPVVILQEKGGFFCDPRWGNTVRKGHGSRPFIGLKRVILPEEQDGLTTDELFDLVKQNLYYNAFEDQEVVRVKYTGRKLAENIERTLFLCPNCHKMVMFSKNNVFGCNECGLRVKYTEYGGFEKISGNQPFKNIFEWDKWQIGHIAATDYGLIDDGDTVTTDGAITLFDITKQKRRDIIGKKGVLSLTKKGLIYQYVKRGKAEILKFNIDNIDMATIQGKVKLEIHTSDGQALLFKSPKNVSSYKYMVLIYRLKAFGERKEFDYYGI